MTQIYSVILYLICRSPGIKVPLLSNDLSERSCLAFRPAQRELLGSLNFRFRKAQPYSSEVLWFIK